MTTPPEGAQHAAAVDAAILMMPPFYWDALRRWDRILVRDVKLADLAGTSRLISTPSAMTRTAGVARNSASSAEPGLHRLATRRAKKGRALSGLALGTTRRSGVDISSQDPPATLHGELDVLEARTGRSADSNAPHQQTPFGFVERGRSHRVGPTEPPANGPAVERVGPSTANRPQHRQ
jgi:hypothetical protein